MECNKEEAIRAKEIAEARMQNNDFAGALRFAQKAQRLFPELENLSQMLAVCEIHCSAQTTVCGSEHDWYGILQIEKSADDITIKKQYRKFALLLHPDKNKFTGAEAAFKLIVEANRVLTDQLQRKLYDSKFRKSVLPQKPPARQPTRYSGARKNGTGNKSESPPNSHFSSSNPNQQGQQQTFWTSCPLCNIRYQYYRQFVNKALRCQTCKKPFIAYDFSTQGMAPGPQWNHFAKQPDFSNFGFSKATPEAHNGVPPMQFADGFSGSVPLTKQKDHGEVDGSLRAKVRNESIDKGTGMEEDRTPYGNAARQTEMGSQSTTGWTGCGNSDVEFGGASENVNRNDAVGDAGTSQDGINSFQSNSELDGAMRSQQKQPPSRKSSRLKQRVSYNDNSVGGDDFVSPPKRSRPNRASDSAEAKKKQETVEGFSNDCSTSKYCINNDIKNEKVIPQKESLSGKESGETKPEEKRGEAVSGDEHNEKSKSESSSRLDPGLEPHVVICPDPDFSDFEKDKAQTCFAVNQVWALYDTIDGMPRFYARIKKVFSPGFKVQITWLEADPDDQDEIEWCNNELPVACGKYRNGHTEEIEDHLMFSHQIEWLKGARRGSVLVYPRKGEIWALFKNWDIKWSSEPQKYLPSKYEYVEILSDFDKDCGIKVVYLSKVKGFVCLFQRVDARKDANASFEIAPRDLYRFAHRVPSFMMTGNERRGVPAGSFELDPAALDIDELKDTVEKKSADADVRKRVPKNSTVETLPVRRSPRALSKQR